MSLEAITWAYKTQVGSSAMKAVLLVLANYADEDDSAYPGIVRIARMTELSERTVQRAVAEMEELGIVRVDRGEGLKGTNRYFLNLGWVAEGGGDTVTPPPGDTVTGGGDTVASNTKKTQERDTQTPSRASRRDVEKPVRSRKKQRPEVETDEGQERTGGLPDDDPEEPDAPASAPERGWSTFSLVNEFHRRALRASTVPRAARDTKKGPLGKTLKKWQTEGTATPAEIAKAMEVFFVNPASSVYDGEPLWLAFVNRFPVLLARLNEPDITNPDYYSSHKKENPVYDRQQYIEEQKRELGL